MRCQSEARRGLTGQVRSAIQGGTRWNSFSLFSWPALGYLLLGVVIFPDPVGNRRLFSDFDPLYLVVNAVILRSGSA